MDILFLPVLVNAPVSEVTTYTMFPRAKAVNCTSTMSIVDDTAYVGAMADGMGYLCVWDMQTHSMRYTVQTGKACEVKATPLVSTAYEDGNYVYYTCNNPPGGVYFIKDTKQGTPAVQKTLYEPAAARQYCMSSIVAGSNGVLYYSNDTGTLFAVSEVEHSSDIVPSASPAVTKSPAGMSKPSTSVKPMASKTKRPKTPTKVRLVKKKNGCKISWKKGKLATRTIVYVKVGKGKWKKCASTIVVSLSEQNQEKSTVSTAQCKEKRQEMDLLRIYQKVPISQMIPQVPKQARKLTTLQARKQLTPYVRIACL